jgi:ATP-binding cassette subfamily F protein uup
MLFARPANVIVLDEPTNDLDIESLELLEATLQEYPGTVLLVSHDRRFLDNVVTQTLAAEGDGRWKEYVGGYNDWLEQRPRTPDPPPRAASATVAAERAKSPGDARSEGKPAKLSYKETRDLAQLPTQIEALEVEQRAINERMSQPDYHKQGTAQIKADGLRLVEIEQQLATAFDRWAELEARAAALKTNGPA